MSKPVSPSFSFSFAEVSRNSTEKVHISNLLRARLARMPRQIREIQPRNEKTTTNAIFRYRLVGGAFVGFTKSRIVFHVLLLKELFESADTHSCKDKAQ